MARFVLELSGVGIASRDLFDRIRVLGEAFSAGKGGRVFRQGQVMRRRRAAACQESPVLWGHLWNGMFCLDFFPCGKPYGCRNPFETDLLPSLSLSAERYAVFSGNGKNRRAASSPCSFLSVDGGTTAGRNEDDQGC